MILEATQRRTLGESRRHGAPSLLLLKCTEHRSHHQNTNVTTTAVAMDSSLCIPD